jgi:hypothetical protein
MGKRVDEGAESKSFIESWGLNKLIEDKDASENVMLGFIGAALGAILGY